MQRPCLRSDMNSFLLELSKHPLNTYIVWCWSVFYHDSRNMLYFVIFLIDRFYLYQYRTDKGWLPSSSFLKILFKRWNPISYFSKSSLSSFAGDLQLAARVFPSQRNNPKRRTSEWYINREFLIFIHALPSTAVVGPLMPFAVASMSSCSRPHANF